MVLGGEVEHVLDGLAVGAGGALDRDAVDQDGQHGDRVGAEGDCQGENFAAVAHYWEVAGFGEWVSFLGIGYWVSGRVFWCEEGNVGKGGWGLTDHSRVVGW